jgi:hypothetical protein
MIGQTNRERAARKKFASDVCQRQVVVVPDEFVQTYDDGGRVDWASGFGWSVRAGAAEETGGEISEGICSAFGECAPYWGICRVGIAELVEGFTNNGGLVGGETAGEHGLTKQGRDKRQAARRPWCAGFTQMLVCERLEVAATLGVNIYLSARCRLDEQVAVLIERFLTTFRRYFCECVEMPDCCFPGEQQISERGQAAQHVHPTGGPTSFEGCHGAAPS